MRTKVTLVIIVLSALFAGIWFFSSQFNQDKSSDGERPINDDEEIADIIVTSPKEGETVSFPLLIEGKAKGTWFFEASFPIRILGENGKIKADLYAQAQGDWMTEDFVPFHAEVTSMDFFDGEDGTIILSRDNPSGLPDGSKSHYVFFRFPNPSDYERRFVYWQDASAIDEGGDCTSVKPSIRLIQKDTNQIEEVLSGLVAGTSAQETLSGYTTSIPKETELIEINQEDGTLTIEFNEALDQGIAGSCLVRSIRAQIEKTASQFDGVDKVKLVIGERMDDEVLQP